MAKQVTTSPRLGRFGPFKYRSREADVLGSVRGGVRRGDEGKIQIQGRFTSLKRNYFSLCLSVARIDTPTLQPAAQAFVPYGFVLLRVRRREAIPTWVFSTRILISHNFCRSVHYNSNSASFHWSGTQWRGRGPPGRGHGVSSGHSQAPERGTRHNRQKGVLQRETRAAEGAPIAVQNGGAIVHNTRTSGF